MKKTLYVLICAACVLSSLGTDARAETSNDFYKLYGKGITVDISGIKKEINDAKRSIDGTIQAEYYNAVVESIDINEVDKKISDMMFRKSDIEAEMSTAFDYSVDRILALEAEYDKLLNDINYQLKVKDAYTGVEALPKPVMDLSEISTYIQTRENKIKELTTFVELGEVKNVRHPLNNKYRVNSPFGNRVDPLGFRGTYFHTGLDLYAQENTEVIAVFNGTIKSTGWSDSVGNYLRIDHGDGIETYMCHLNKVLVKVGDKVKQYDKVALSGGTGSLSTGPHLHFNLYLQGELVDPAILFEQGGSKTK